MSRRFFDAASGQPLHPAAFEASSAIIQRSWADPAMSHHEGRVARQLLEAARQTVADVLGVRPAGITFQRPGRDVAFTALDGLCWGLECERGSSPALLTSEVERAAVLEAADCSVRDPDEDCLSLGVGPDGRIELDSLEHFLIDNDEPLVACIQAANVEIGTRQPLAEIFALTAAAGVPIAVDGTGALGFGALPRGWSALFADASGFGGPRGIAVLAIAEGSNWRGRDGSDAPVDVDDAAAAAIAAVALDAVHRDGLREAARLSALVERVRHTVTRTVPDVEVLGAGDPAARLPGTVTFSCLYADGERLAGELDRLGFAVGSGSACASRTGLPSHVLEAIGSLTHGNVRVSLPWGCDDAGIDEFLAVLPAAVAAVRAEAGAPS